MSREIPRKCGGCGRFRRRSRRAGAQSIRGPASPMKQSRRVSPRVPYDEAVCLSRTDDRGRLNTRSIDLSSSGISVVCSESVPIGTEVRCTMLLPGGPRTVPGRVVRVLALPRGFGIAVEFIALWLGPAAAICQFVDARARDVRPARLRVDG